MSVGDTFHLVFVTSATTKAEETGILYYNTFVNDVANNVDPYSGSIVAKYSWTWKAIASTSGSDAIENTGTTWSDAIPGNRIFQIKKLGGYDQIADDYKDLWDGNIDHAIDRDEQGGLLAVVNASTVWTGTWDDGKKQDPLGSANPYAARYSWGHDPQWIRKETQPQATEYRMYALSELVTIIPEPATLALLVLGLPFVMRRKRR